MSLFHRLFGKKGSDEPSEFRALLDRSMEELRAKTAAHDAAWHLGEADWSVDQDAGTIVFARPDGISATCPVQIIGTYNTEDGTFLWGWDHPSVAPPLQEHARKVRDYGGTHRIERLTTRKVSCSEDEAWEFAALACHLCDAQGAYRGPSGATLVYMTFGEVTLQSSQTDEKEKVSPETMTEGLEEIEAPDVIEFVQRYFSEMFAIEEKAHPLLDAEDDGGAFQRAVEGMQEIYGRYWRADNDYWMPCSVGWPSEYELARTQNWKVYRLGPDEYRVAYQLEKATILDNAYDVKRFADGLRIVDFHY